LIEAGAGNSHRPVTAHSQNAATPVGIALDRYGPRRVQSVLLLVAAIGAALFGAAHTLAGFTVGRALIGLGVAVGLIAGSRWLF
jgi:MFS family permease